MADKNVSGDKFSDKERLLIATKLSDKERLLIDAEKANLALAVEYGYRCCERGMNLQATLLEFEKLLPKR